jgi:hypothetical protein
MHDPLHRLYRAKLVLLATLLLFGGLAFLVLGQWGDRQPSFGWLSAWPVADVGSALFTTGLLGVAWQYLDGRDSEVRDTERLKRVLAESAPAMRDAVINGFAFAPEDLARVSTPETLDQIITNGLAIDLPERLYDARVAIHLSPYVPSSQQKRRADEPELLTVTMRWEYQIAPVYPTRRSICTSDLREFRELSQDVAGTSAWYLTPKGHLEAQDKAAFELVDFTVDGMPRTIRRSAKATSQTYSVSLGTGR